MRASSGFQLRMPDAGAFWSLDHVENFEIYLSLREIVGVEFDFVGRIWF